MSTSISLDAKWYGAYFAVPLLTKHCLSSMACKLRRPAQICSHCVSVTLLAQLSITPTQGNAE